jgi:hypothetical protein
VSQYCQHMSSKLVGNSSTLSVCSSCNFFAVVCLGMFSFSYGDGLVSELVF